MRKSELTIKKTKNKSNASSLQIVAEFEGKGYCMNNTQYRLAIDVGGTFTDVVLINERSGQIEFTKTLSTPHDPSEGVMNGIKKIMKITGVKPEQIEYFVHGTTYATNALLERKGSKVALLTTEGFRDVIEIGRQKRSSLYDLNMDKLPTLVERRFRFGIDERMSAKGQVITPINKATVIKAVNAIKEEGIQSICITFLHAYANPEHERLAAKWVKEWYPECFISLSHEISPEFREYERTMTTVMNAYLKPNTSKYFHNLVQRMEKMNVKIPYIMKSSGGVMSAESASERSVDTLLSGPAGGVIGATFIANKMGLSDIVTLDMGGTSTDVALIKDQSPKVTMEGILDGFPLKVPMIDMETIGAGGGSIGHLDPGGVLKVGPESAGSNPGPACYNLGGKEPTITDANVVLGKIDPSYFLGGEMTLSIEEAKKAFIPISKKTGLLIEEIAQGMLSIANHNMAEAVRLVSVRKGYNPKDFTLFSFGGASPLHATEIANELGMSRIVIPKGSSELSALGFLVADLRHDFATTRLISLESRYIREIETSYYKLEERAIERLSEEGVRQEARQIIYRMDLRYRGQAFEITLNLKSSPQDADDIKNLIERFHNQHKLQYGHSDPNQSVDIVTLRVSAIGHTKQIELESLPNQGKQPQKSAQKGSRRVYSSSSQSFEEVSVYYLDHLTPGNCIHGPTILDGKDTTVIVNHGQTAMVDSYGNVIIKTDEGEN